MDRLVPMLLCYRPWLLEQAHLLLEPVQWYQRQVHHHLHSQRCLKRHLRHLSHQWSVHLSLHRHHLCHLRRHLQLPCLNLLLYPDPPPTFHLFMPLLPLLLHLLYQHLHLLSVSQ